MSRTALYQGKIFQITTEKVFSENGAYDCEIARRSPGVRIICYQNEQIFLIRENRREFEATDFRLPGGKVFDTLEDFIDFSGDIESRALSAGIRELVEEAGISADSGALFGVSVCGATIEWDLYYFVVSRFHLVERQIQSGEEGITGAWYTYDAIWNLLIQGKIQEGRTAAILMQFIARHRPLKIGSLGSTSERDSV